MSTVGRLCRGRGLSSGGALFGAALAVVVESYGTYAGVLWVAGAISWVAWVLRLKGEEDAPGKDKSGPGKDEGPPKRMLAGAW